MRRHPLKHIIQCDRDLTQIANNRVLITAIGEGQFEFTSYLKLYRCESSEFVRKFICSRLGKPKWVLGNCSRPDGYLYNDNGLPGKDISHGEVQKPDKKCQNWTPVKEPPAGLVHVLMKDDTEQVVDSVRVSWDAGWFGKKGVRVLCFKRVTPKYAIEFNQGKHRAIDATYLFTARLLKRKSMEGSKDAELHG